MGPAGRPISGAAARRLRRSGRAGGTRRAPARRLVARPAPRARGVRHDGLGRGWAGVRPGRGRAVAAAAARWIRRVGPIGAAVRRRCGAASGRPGGTRCAPARPLGRPALRCHDRWARRRGGPASRARARPRGVARPRRQGVAVRGGAGPSLCITHSFSLSSRSLPFVFNSISARPVSLSLSLLLSLSLSWSVDVMSLSRGVCLCISVLCLSVSIYFFLLLFFSLSRILIISLSHFFWSSY